jgi:pyridoxine kinase
MATVLALSSFVARGSVGLRAAMPALDRLGHETIACPTTVLSNHLGHRRAAGAPVPLDVFSDMLTAIEDNGWLESIDAVLTGYMPSPGHADAAARVIDRLRAGRASLPVFCDPVMGDLPGGLYVDRAVAEAMLAALLPRATHLKPNLFELSVLAGLPSGDLKSPQDVVAVARLLRVPVVLVSSVPFTDGRLANIVVTGEDAALCCVPRETAVPHGTGDLLAALFAGHILAGARASAAAASATSAVASAIALSRGHDELRLADRAPWHAAPPSIMTQVAPV